MIPVLMLCMGAMLGWIGNIFTLGLVGSLSSALFILLLIRSEGFVHTGLSVGFAWLMLMVGFGAAITVEAMRTRQTERRNQEAAAQRRIVPLQTLPN